MPATKLLKNSWNAGELSQYMDGRTDLSKYYNGGSKVINALVLPHGGFTKRPGTIYKATSATRANLTEFEFSVNDSLVLEWTNVLLRFYKDKAQVFEPFGTEDLSAFDSATGDSSLVAHWLCNDNLATNAILDDAIAGNHDGTSVADTDTFSVADAEGTANSAFDIGGSEIITIPDHPDLSFGDGSDDSPFSVAIWAKVVLAGSGQTLISKFEIPDFEWMCFMNADETLSFRLYDKSGADYIQVSTLVPLTADWHFLVFTKSTIRDTTAAAGDDGTKLGMHIYVDYHDMPLLLIQNPAAYVAMESLGGDVKIGSRQGGTEWEGSIDKVAIFNKELSFAEVLSLTGNDSTTPYSITSPYTTAQAFGIHYTQSADVMYSAHNDVFPKKLSRNADYSWVIEDVPFTGGPFLTENVISSSLIGFARTGGTARSGYYFLAGATGTLTATGGNNSPFNTNMIGALWLIKHTRPDNTTSTQDNDTNAAPTLIAFPKAVRTKGDFTFDISKYVAGTDSAKLWRKAGDGEWQEYRTFTAATAFTATEEEDDVFFAFSFSVNTMKGTFTARDQINYGIVKITAFTSSTVVTVTVIDPVLSNNSSDAAVTTSMWAEGAWSTFRGFARTVGFHEDWLRWA